MHSLNFLCGLCLKPCPKARSFSSLVFVNEQQSQTAREKCKKSGLKGTATGARAMTAQAGLISLDVDQEFDCLRECTYVEEADDIRDILRKTVETKGLDAKHVYPRFKRIVRLSC